ncbi:MAG: carbohydrate kinase [Nitrospinota bacterium]|nr:MAG: carbohydrate kinase [Nitrospinota bacterium]
MIVVCGEALIDFTPSRSGTEPGYLCHPGGSPYNVAVALGRLEVPVAFLGKVSHDFFGQQLRRHLQANGVDLRYLREGAEPTALAFVHLEGGQEPCFTFYGERTADRMLFPTDLPVTFTPEIQALHFGSLALVLEPIASTLEELMCREQGRRLLSLDPNIRPALIADRRRYRNRLESWVERVDLIKASAADLSWLSPGVPIEQIARQWLDRGSKAVIITRGAEGAVGFLPGGTRVQVPGISVRVVDTVGAGDAFTAGLLAWLYRKALLHPEQIKRLRPAELTQALSYASRVAALTCTRAGAYPPHRWEVEKG